MTVDTDLATLREQLRHLGPWRGAVGDEALDRVEAELARLQEGLRDAAVVIEKMANGASRAEVDPEFSRFRALLADTRYCDEHIPLFPEGPGEDSGYGL